MACYENSFDADFTVLLVGMLIYGTLGCTLQFISLHVDALSTQELEQLGGIFRKNFGEIG